MISYSEWLKKQSISFQNDVLGKERAELFRKGELSVEKFENPKPITLDQFKSKVKTNGTEAQN